MKNGGFLPVLAVLSILTVNSCTTSSSDTPKPPSEAEVIQMSKEGVPADTIIAKMRASEAVYPLSAAELARLHDKGVPDRVIDYMQATYLRVACGAVV